MAFFIAVGGGDDNAFGADDEIHRAAHAGQRRDEPSAGADEAVIFLLGFGADAETAVFSLNNKAGLSGRKIELYDLCF